GKESRNPGAERRVRMTPLGGCTPGPGEAIDEVPLKPACGHRELGVAELLSDPQVGCIRWRHTSQPLMFPLQGSSELDISDAARSRLPGEPPLLPPRRWVDVQPPLLDPTAPNADAVLVAVPAGTLPLADEEVDLEASGLPARFGCQGENG